VVRRSPAELYLKYLIVRHDKYNDKQVVEVARAQGLDALGAFYIRNLRRSLVTPVPFYPENRQHKPSFRFLMAKDLFRFYCPDRHMEVALRLFGQPRAKELIETMVLSKTPASWIVSALSREGIKATGEAITHFRAAFFNVDLVDELEMRTLLRLRFQASGTSSDPEFARLEAAYEKEAWCDSRVSAANAPIRSLSTVMSAIRLGMLPSNADFSKVMTATRFVAAIRALEAATRNGRDDHERSQSYMSVTATANTVLESVGSPEEDLQSKLLNIQLRTEEGELPLLEDVSQGLHTAELEIPGGVSANSEPGESNSSESGGSAG
jgi:hypothetical protein